MAKTTYFDLSVFTYNQLVELKPEKMTQCSNDIYSFLLQAKTDEITYVSFVDIYKCINHPHSTAYRSMTAINKLLISGVPTSRLYNCSKETPRPYKRNVEFKYSGGHNSVKSLENMKFTHFSDIVNDYKYPNDINIYNNLLNNKISNALILRFSDTTTSQISTSPSVEVASDSIAIPSVQDIWLRENKIIPGKIEVKEEIKQQDSDLEALEVTDK